MIFLFHLYYLLIAAFLKSRREQSGFILKKKTRHQQPTMLMPGIF